MSQCMGLVCGLLIALGSAWCSPCFCQGFMELRGELVTSKSSGDVMLVVSEVFHVVRQDSVTPMDTLSVDCSATGDLVPWRASFTSGDTLRLAWEVERKPSRGFLFFGGRGGRGTLSIPKQGWAIPCACEGKSGTKNGNLFGVFVDETGSASGQRTFQGGGESPFLRALIVPLWHGKAAKPSGTVRIRSGWHQDRLLPQQEDSRGGPSS